MKNVLKKILIILPTLGIFLIIFIFKKDEIFSKSDYSLRLNYIDEKKEISSDFVPSYKEELGNNSSNLIISDDEANLDISKRTDTHIISSENIFINQNPELPTGCEITSLAMLLNYKGVYADKCDIADNYLKKKPAGEADYTLEFIGNPREENSFGCYAPVIADTANKFLTAKNSELKAYNISGMDFYDLLVYIDNNSPVIVWNTISLMKSYVSDVWNVNGQTISWRANEHCVLLIGYDFLKKTVTVLDPLIGEKEYDMEIFIKRYNELYKQAVIIN